MALSDIVQEDLKWMDASNCIGKTEPFDNYDSGGVYSDEADQLCLTCPVIKECFETGIKGEYGQWGGIYWAGNGKPDLRSNEHKTPEYIKEIEDLVS